MQHKAFMPLQSVEKQKRKYIIKRKTEENPRKRFLQKKYQHNFNNFNKLSLTSHNKFSGTLCLAQRVDCNNPIFTAVLFADSENIHGAHTKWVGDVIVVVWVDADVVEVPRHSGRRASSDSTCHVELVTFRWCVDLQRDQDGWGPLKAYLHWINSIWWELNLIEKHSKMERIEMII